jgi:2-oxoglutarate ferredoxin oxidoreductase subunit gamma
VILYDPAFVQVDESKKVLQVPIAAKDVAVEKLGRAIYANTIMIGALTKALGILDKDVVLSTVLEVIPKFKDENKRAFEIGYDLYST